MPVRTNDELSIEITLLSKIILTNRQQSVMFKLRKATFHLRPHVFEHTMDGLDVLRT